MKRVVFVGSALRDIRAFPDDARSEAGYQLGRVQRGLEPDHWKPMTGIGPGVREIRVRDGSGAFQVIYIATWDEAIYVLHAFQKRTQRTAQRDLGLAATRLRQLAKDRPA